MIYKSSCFLLGIFIVFLSAPLFAQTAQRIETLLNVPALNWAAAASFVLEASEQVVLNETDAFRFAAERKWLPKRAAPDENARLNGISLLLLQSFNVKGGIMYSLTKNAHYAYRELVYKDIIQGRTDPDMAVSGEELLFMVSRLLAIREAEEEKADAARLLADEEAQRLARQRSEDEALVREINAQLAAQQVSDTTARVTREGVTISLSNIQFLANSAELADSEQVKIQEIGRILQTISERHILVAGHTALAGTRAAQHRTSLERARSVADYLITLEVRTASEITVRGYGADQPVADNNTERGMAQNRRVEITILHRGER